MPNKLNYAQGNNKSDTLSTSVGAGDLTLPVNSISIWATNGGKVIIDRGLSTQEIVYVSGKSGSSLTVPSGGRGAEGTSAQGHNAGATVESVPFAGDWNDVIDTLTNGFLATTGAVDSTKVPVVSGGFATTLTTTASTNVTLPTTGTLTSSSNIQTGGYTYAADAGASDDYVVTLSPVPAAYTTGMIVRFKANTANTGAATLNVNSLGAKTIVKNYNVTLADNDIKANQLVEVIYDGTNFQLLSPVSNSVASNYIAGSLTHDVSVTGTQSFTGSSFTPKGIHLIASFGGGTSSAFSHGFSDGTHTLTMAIDNGGKVWTDAANIGVVWVTAPGTNALIAFTSFNSNGFTITWSKNGSPTGTATLYFQLYG